jgi:hypothetical protein
LVLRMGNYIFLHIFIGNYIFLWWMNELNEAFQRSFQVCSKFCVFSRQWMRSFVHQLRSMVSLTNHPKWFSVGSMSFLKIDMKLVFRFLLLLICRQLIKTREKYFTVIPLFLTNGFQLCKYLSYEPIEAFNVTAFCTKIRSRRDNWSQEVRPRDKQERQKKCFHWG